MEVDSTTVGQLLHPPADVRRFPVIDYLVSSQLLGFFKFPVAARGGYDPGSEHLGYLNAHAGHAAARRLDQHVVPGTNLALSNQAMPGSMGGNGQSGALGKGHGVGNAVGVNGRSGDVFGVTSIQVHSEPLLVGAILIQPLQAAGAGAALGPVV